MFRKLKKLVLEYDKKFFTWLEGKSLTGPKNNRQTSTNNHARTKVSDRRMVSPSNEVQIPDPWD